MNESGGECDRNAYVLSILCRSLKKSCVEHEAVRDAKYCKEKIKRTTELETESTRARDGQRDDAEVRSVPTLPSVTSYHRYDTHQDIPPLVHIIHLSDSDLQ